MEEMNYKQVEELIDQGRLESGMIEPIMSDMLKVYSTDKDARRVMKKIIVDMGATNFNLIWEETDVMIGELRRIFIYLVENDGVPAEEVLPRLLTLFDQKAHTSDYLELNFNWFTCDTIDADLLSHMVMHKGVTKLLFYDCVFDDTGLDKLALLAPRLSLLKFEDCDICDSILIDTFKNVAGKLIIDGREIPRICETFVQSQKEQLAQCTNVYCAVCMESVEKVHACMLPCGHVFCSTCVLRARTWECFVCKVPYTPCALKFF
jgi:hypothetical protein